MLDDKNRMKWILISLFSHKVLLVLDGTRVTEKCTTVLDTCIDNYANCNGSICDCIHDFTWNGSFCGKMLCVLFLLKPFFLQTISFLQSEISTCNSSVWYCKKVKMTKRCMSHEIYIHFYAVGPDLCDPCSPSPLSCEGGLVCGLESYRCECPPGQVQIGDNCCKYLFMDIIFLHFIHISILFWWSFRLDDCCFKIKTDVLAKFC